MEVPKEDELDDEEMEFYKAKSAGRIMLVLKLIVLLLALALGSTFVIMFHLRVHECSDGLQPHSKQVAHNLSSLNVRRIVVRKNRGHVRIVVDDEQGLRVVVTHRGRTFASMREVESIVNQQQGLVTITSDWPVDPSLVTS